VSLRSEVPRFALVGIAATLVHVTAALVLARLVPVREELANIFGFFTAVMVSYFGHSYYTFGRNTAHGFQVPRFVVLSGLGLVVSTAVTWFTCTVFGGPLGLAMALVAVTVPGVTFVGMKLWVFAARHHRS
jgi:putative flippase GtrA